MPRYAAFLRGINVGGNKKVTMADLRACLEAMGCENVRTLLQSGNVVFDSDKKSPADLEESLGHQCKAVLGLETRFFVRDLKQLEALVEKNPFESEAQEDPSHLLVVFLDTSPSASAVKQVADAIAGPEKLAHFDAHCYVAYPAGIGDSKVDRTPGWKALLGKGTGRNWNTLLKVIAAMTN